MPGTLRFNHPVAARLSRKYQYGILCLLLTLSLLLGLPLRETGYGAGVFGALGIAAIFAAAVAGSSSRRPRLRSLVAVLPLALLNLKIAWLGGGNDQAAIGTILLAGYLAFIAARILLHLARNDQVTVDIVVGGICVYLLIGLIFAYLYSTLEMLRPGSILEGGRLLRGLPREIHLIIRRPELTYFSFETLTTLGFGDIVPVHPIARVLCAFEAVVGQIYVVTFLSFLVGNYIAQRERATAERRIVDASTADLSSRPKGEGMPEGRDGCEV